MFRFLLALLLLVTLSRAWAQAPRQEEVWDQQPSEENLNEWSELPDAPSALRSKSPYSASETTKSFFETLTPGEGFRAREDGAVALNPATFERQSRTGRPGTEMGEPYHWKGLILQSFAFNMLSNATRVITADQNDRHLLLNKPYWSDYWASLQQFNMHRWNDGDSIKVNYIGHPMEGAIAGYIEVQNDPRGRELQISRNRPYWNSRFRAFLWATVYSTYWEMGPTGETAIFNQGGFTYPIGCKKNDVACEATAKYTNNTGWVDFIITPIVGTLWLLGEDTIDRYVSDPLVRRHPNSFGIKMVRASLNPPASLANILRGHFPWWRDYEHPSESESFLIRKFEHAMDVEPEEHVDLYLHYRSLSLGTYNGQCFDCRNTTSGAGVEVGVAVRRYLDVIADVSVHPEANPVSSLNVGGTLTAANFGVRSGYSGKRFAAKVSLAPGLRATRRRNLRRQNPIQIPERGGISISPPLARFPGMSALLSTWHFERPWNRC